MADSDSDSSHFSPDTSEVVSASSGCELSSEDDDEIGSGVRCFTASKVTKEEWEEKVKTWQKLCDTVGGVYTRDLKHQIMKVVLLPLNILGGRFRLFFSIKRMDTGRSYSLVTPTFCTTAVTVLDPNPNPNRIPCSLSNIIDALDAAETAVQILDDGRPGSYTRWLAKVTKWSADINDGLDFALEGDDDDTPKVNLIRVSLIIESSRSYPTQDDPNTYRLGFEARLPWLCSASVFSYQSREFYPTSTRLPVNINSFELDLKDIVSALNTAKGAAKPSEDTSGGATIAASFPASSSSSTAANVPIEAKTNGVLGKRPRIEPPASGDDTESLRKRIRADLQQLLDDTRRQLSALLTTAEKHQQEIKRIVDFMQQF